MPDPLDYAPRDQPNRRDPETESQFWFGLGTGSLVSFVVWMGVKVGLFPTFLELHLLWMVPVGKLLTACALVLTPDRAAMGKGVLVSIATGLLIFLCICGRT